MDMFGNFGRDESQRPQIDYQPLPLKEASLWNGECQQHFEDLSKCTARNTLSLGQYYKLGCCQNLQSDQDTTHDRLCSINVERTAPSSVFQCSLSHLLEVTRIKHWPLLHKHYGDHSFIF